MATNAVDLADKISQIDLRVKNTREKLSQLRTDINHPHIMQKQLAEIRTQLASQYERIASLEKSERYCESRLDIEVAKATAEKLSSEILAYNDERSKLFTEYEALTTRQAATKAASPDLKAFDKLTKNLTPDELKELLQATLSAMRGASNADVPVVS